MIISNFFVYRRPNHLYLHSFPTRRSSDLFHAGRQLRSGLSAGAVRLCRIGADLGWAIQATGPGDVLSSRSEEHTSELQSRPHLVCRLLLEKKKLAASISRAAPKCRRAWAS